MPGIGDCRYARPIRGASPSMSNDSLSSSRNRSGDDGRFSRHQSSIARTCASASGVVRTGRFTCADAVRPQSSMRVGDGPPGADFHDADSASCRMPALLVREVVAFIIGNQVNNGPFRERCRQVENKPAFLDARWERAHVANVRVSPVADKSSRLGQAQAF